MKRAWRVAVREYLENTKTKGFWIGILMFPIMIVVFSQVPQFLEEKAVPTRHYLLVDRSGEFTEIVREGVESRNRRRVLESLMQFVQENAPPPDPDATPMEVPQIDRDEAESQLGLDLDELGIEPGKALSAWMVKALVEALPDEIFENGTQFDSLVRMTLRLLPEGTPEFTPPRPRFVEVAFPEGISPELPDAELEEALKPFLTGSERLSIDEGERADLFALLILPPDLSESHRGMRYWSSNRADTDLETAAKRSISAELRHREYERRGVSPAVVEEVEAIQVRSESFDPKKAAGEEKVGLVDTLRQYAPIGFVYLLWIAIFSTAQMLLNNMIEEKSNRIVEVLLSSVTPTELMGGKLFGIALLGLTMLVAWLISLYGVLQWKASPEAEWALGLIDVVLTPQMLIPFIVYFIFGYLMYAGIFASIGSVCNTIKDAQNFMGPIMMILMVPLITMFFIPRDPNGTLATVLSWIPIYTPFVMMNRAAADPPLFDLVGTMILLIVTTGFLLWASGRIFRAGMLRTGQPPRILELIHWVRRPA